MTQAVLLQLWFAQGRIVLVSSLVGKVAFLLIYAYSASKFALQAVGDVLRIELKRWNSAVVLIEVGATDTDMYWDGYVRHVGWRGGGAPRTVRRPFYGLGYLDHVVAGSGVDVRRIRLLPKR
ncbi:hypothetical protein MLPF_1817 [Mycobacterium lepromatosis]|nr:hypothetical protein MLPF_1817 [Mycobacterium lepromatosis]